MPVDAGLTRRYHTAWTQVSTLHTPIKNGPHSCGPFSFHAKRDQTRFIRKVVSSGTGRPVAPFDAPLFHAVPAISKWAQV